MSDFDDEISIEFIDLDELLDGIDDPISPMHMFDAADAKVILGVAAYPDGNLIETYDTEYLNPQQMAILLCDLLRKTADRYGVSELEMFAYFDAERRQPQVPVRQEWDRDGNFRLVTWNPETSS